MKPKPTKKLVVNEFDLYKYRHVVLMAKGHYLVTGSVYQDICRAALGDGVNLKSRKEAVGFMMNLAIEALLGGDDVIAELQSHFLFLFDRGTSAWEKRESQGKTVSVENYHSLLLEALLAIIMRWDMSDLKKELGDPDPSVLPVQDQKIAMNYYSSRALFNQKESQNES